MNQRRTICSTMKAIFICIGVSFFVFSIVNSAYATYMSRIDYDYSSIGANQYKIDFSVQNNSTGADNALLNLVVIYLRDSVTAWSDQNVTQATWISSPGWNTYAHDADWTGAWPTMVVAEAPNWGLDGDGISQNNSLSGFSFSFKGSNVISPDDFDFYYYTDFGYNTSGMTGWGDVTIFGGQPEGRVVSRMTAVPEPSTMFLLGAGFLVFFGYRKRLKAD